MLIRPYSILTVVALMLVLASPAVGAQKIYWTDSFTGKIQRADPDGTNVEDLVSTGLIFPRGIALDVAGGKMYWTDSGTNKIERADLNGLNRHTILIGWQGPRGIVLDVAAGRMYWATRDDGMIRRAHLDGSHIDVVVTGLDHPMGLAIDFTSGVIYWANLAVEELDTADGAIQRATLNGANIADLVPDLVDPVGVAIDLAGGKIYWTDFATGIIQRANFDGSGSEYLVTGVAGPLGLALDLDRGKLYWTEAGNGTSEDFDGKIWRANLDGSDVENVISTGLRNPREIAILPDPCINGASCDDNNRCTFNDACVEGICTGLPLSGACDDGNPCTGGDVCGNGQCRGTPIGNLCDDGDPCTTDVCFNGGCRNTQDNALEGCFAYSLMVTEVNGTPCPSCPTASLPAHEVLPGDTITVEAFLSNWSPHLLGWFEWAIDATTFESAFGNAIAGSLDFAQTPCVTDADCRNAFVQSDYCTCNHSTCQETGMCDAHAPAFIDTSRSDYALPDFNLARVCTTLLCSGRYHWSGATGAFGYGINDPGTPAYVGSLVLTASADARGTFTITMFEDPFTNDTGVYDHRGTLLVGVRLLPVVINFCETLDDSDNDGICDSADICPGVDDAVFGPECDGAIPTASGWGLVVLALLVLIGGKIYFGRGNAAA